MSFTLFSTGWVETLRAVPRRVLHVGLLVLTGVGFVALTHGHGIGASGTAVAYGEAVRYSMAPAELGRVEQVLVHVGQKVRAGEPVAVLDGRELAAKRDTARAELAQLEAEVVAQIQDNELQMTRSELSVLKARAADRGDRAQLQELSQRVKRLDDLLAQQMVTATDAESARAKQQELTARVATFDEARQRGQAGLANKGADTRDHGRAVELHVEPARRAVQVQEALLRQLDLRAEQLTLRAPVDSTVAVLSRRPGEVVSAGTEVVALVTGRPDVLMAELPEGMADRVSVGQSVTVRSKDFFVAARHGRIIELAPGVAEVPQRARPSPAISAWGRSAMVQIDPGSEVLPGQAFNVSLD
jgi:multidrug resistance efflux pump